MKLAAHGISVRLGHRDVLRSVDTVIVPGRITGIIGPNGAGKSTLIRSLAGLVPPTSGAIDLGDSPLTRVAGAARGRQIAYLAQERTVHWALAVDAVVAKPITPESLQPVIRRLTDGPRATGRN